MPMSLSYVRIDWVTTGAYGEYAYPMLTYYLFQGLSTWRAYDHKKHYQCEGTHLQDSGNQHNSCLVLCSQEVWHMHLRSVGPYSWSELTASYLWVIFKDDGRLDAHFHHNGYAAMLLHDPLRLS